MKHHVSKHVWGCAAAVVAALPAVAQLPDPPGQVSAGQTALHQAYLFAHMMHGDYGRLYYSVSLDGLHWQLLNQGRRISSEYRGHADICRGHDGRYYLVGNRNDSAPDIQFWVSEDLIDWARYGDYTPDLTTIPDYPTAMARIGAPKLFFDQAASRYLLTWHTPHHMPASDLPEPYWASQRTLYVTSPDLREFDGPPRKFFDWDMATIDTIIRKVGDSYYALVKDERYPTLDWTTGKTIRICRAPALLGPYSRPAPPISPGFREAPTLIPSPDGQAWYLYYEQYPGVAYGLSVAKRLEGPWFQVSGNTHHQDWDKYSVPPRARHGSMLPISRAEYDALLTAFDSPTEAEASSLDCGDSSPL